MRCSVGKEAVVAEDADGDEELRRKDEAVEEVRGPVEEVVEAAVDPRGRVLVRRVEAASSSNNNNKERELNVKDSGMLNGYGNKYNLDSNGKDSIKGVMELVDSSKENAFDADNEVT